MVPNRISIAAALLAVGLTACATPRASMAPGSADSGQAEWIEGPNSDVRTLIVAPRPVADLDAPALDDARLAIGAFFTRWQSPAGPVDQLALLIELVGDDPMAFISMAPSLLLEIDGVLIQREPGVSGNSISWDTIQGTRRARMVIPITPRELRLLSEAETVRGRIGLWGDFGFGAPQRHRLVDVLYSMPADAQVDDAVVVPRPRITAARRGLELD